MDLTDLWLDIAIIEFAAIILLITWLILTKSKLSRSKTEDNKAQELQDANHKLTKTKEELESANHHLNFTMNELEEANLKLLEIKEKLEKSNNEMHRFAVVATHDFREPLNLIMNYLQLLSNHMKKTVDSTGKEYMDVIVQSGKQIQNLILRLRDFTEIETADDLNFTEISTFRLLTNIKKEGAKWLEKNIYLNSTLYELQQLSLWSGFMLLLP